MLARTRMSILDSVQNFVQTYCDVNTHWKYINTIDTAVKQVITNSIPYVVDQYQTKSHSENDGERGCSTQFEC